MNCIPKYTTLQSFQDKFTLKFTLNRPAVETLCLSFHTLLWSTLGNYSHLLSSALNSAPFIKLWLENWSRDTNFTGIVKKWTPYFCSPKSKYWHIWTPRTKTFEIYVTGSAKTGHSINYRLSSVFRKITITLEVNNVWRSCFHCLIDHSSLSVETEVRSVSGSN